MVDALKWRGQQVELGSPFDFPFEAPEGGCVLNYTYLVHEEHTATFSISQGGAVLHTEQGSSMMGEVRIAAKGMCSIRWESAGVLDWTGLLTPRRVTYEIILVPQERLLQKERRRVVQLAESNALGDLLAALEALPVDVSDDLGRTPLHAAASKGHGEVRAEGETACARLAPRTEPRRRVFCTPLECPFVPAPMPYRWLQRCSNVAPLSNRAAIAASHLFLRPARHSSPRPSAPSSTRGPT